MSGAREVWDFGLVPQEVLMGSIELFGPRPTPAQALRAVLAGVDVSIIPGCFDALSAQLAARAGFPALFMSGFAVSAARLGMPDTGLISFAEMLDTLRNCCCSAAP